MGCGAEVVADTLFKSLTVDANFNVPDIDFDDPSLQPPDGTGDLYKPVSTLTNADLTTGLVGGTGTFDVLMNSVRSHLEKEFETGRITGREFSEATAQGIAAAMGNATQFLLGKEQAHWQAVLVQVQARTAEIEAITARVSLQEAKMRYMQTKFATQLAVADYALKKIQLASADMEYCILQKNLLLKDKELLLADKELEQRTVQITLGNLDADTKRYTNTVLLPLQKDMTDAQIAGQRITNDTSNYRLQAIMPQELQLLNRQGDGQLIQNQTLEYTLQTLMPKQAEMLIGQIAQLTAQTTGLGIDNQTKQYTLTYMLPKQREMLEAQTQGVIIDTATKQFTMDYVLPKQLILIGEQAESARAQTLNTRSDDTTPVTGLIGKQKDLYSQQIISYQRDAETKAGRMFLDTWITQKTIDEGLLAPNNLSNASLDVMLAKIKLENGFV